MYPQTIPIDVSEIVDAESVTSRDAVTAILIIVAALLIAFAVTRLIRRWLSSVEGLPEAARDSLSRMTGYLIVLIGVLIALPYRSFLSACS